MEVVKKDDQKVTKKKRPNFLSRLGQRISRAFTKSKLPNSENKQQNESSSKSCMDDLPVTSKSHDNLKMKEESFKTKRKKFNSFLRMKSCFGKRKTRIPPKNDRCLSEGDLTRDDEKYYSAESSPKPRMGRNLNDSNENNAPLDDSVSANKRNFKNELALKLRSKNSPKQKKDEESDSSKTPDSPTGNCPSRSPPRQIFNDSRTPYSSSSLSYSSNSLLSGTAAGNYTTSDGESMSRSVIDSNDDIGIVVDLTTPISKTTTASLLDSTAARQKIAASRPRRARSKTNDNNKSLSGEKSKDPSSFSPVRESRDILEEISEEDCLPASNSSTLNEEDISPCSNPETSDKLISTLELHESSEFLIINKIVPSEVIQQSSDAVNEDKHPVFTPSNTIQPNESGDSAVKIEPIKSEPVDAVDHNAENDCVKSLFMRNKSKFEDPAKNSRPIVALRPTNTKISLTADSSTNELSKVFNKRTSWAPSSKTQIDPINDSTNSKDDQTDTKTKFNRYTPMNYSNNPKIRTPLTNDTKDNYPTPNSNNSLSIAANPSTAYAENRKSRVLDLIKNLESGVSCADTK